MEKYSTTAAQFEHRSVQMRVWYSVPDTYNTVYICAQYSVWICTIQPVDTCVWSVRSN